MFLGSGIQSTIDSLKAGVGYAAYHNFVNLKGHEVRYLVVPFSTNVDHQAAVAVRSLSEAALNPNGKGWF